jgi:hypothetical protein
VSRAATTRRAIASVRTEIEAWMRARRADRRFARFTGHFTALEQVTRRMLDAIEHDIARAEPDQPSGAVYERCRTADVRLAVVARLHGWYADKYDQRLDDGAATVLRAADEVVRSCWAEAFASVDRDPPTGPLVYLDARFDAVATPRVSVPTDLRAAADVVVGQFVRELPIPLVALPGLCRSEPWWIVLAAHETGHHVQHDLDPGLVTRTRETVAAAAGGDEADCWAAWAQEVFADAFATLMVGPATTWAVEELQHGEPARTVTMPSAGRRYPPPVIRTALLGELAREAGCPHPGPGAADTAEWLDTVAANAVPPPVHAAVAAHLPRVAQVARAVVDMGIDGIPLREVCGWDPGAFATGGRVSRWVQALHGRSPVVPGRAEPAAARHGIAAGVEVYRARCAAATGPSDPLQPLRVHLPTLLAACGPPGTLAATAPPDIAKVATLLTGRLLAEVGGEEMA